MGEVVDLNSKRPPHEEPYDPPHPLDDDLAAMLAPSEDAEFLALEQLPGLGDLQVLLEEAMAAEDWVELSRVLAAMMALVSTWPFNA